MDNVRNGVKWFFLALTTLLTALSGCRRDSVVDCLSEEEESDCARMVSRRMQKTAGVAGLTREQFHRCLTNAFRMARERAFREATYDVIPLYCQLSDGNGDEGILDGERNRFVLDVWGSGTRKAWRDDVLDSGDDVHRIWLAFETFDRSSGQYEVFASSLENLVHGLGSSWSNRKGVGGYGATQYRCNDLLLGMERESESWVRKVADGECRLYFLLGDGHRFGFRIGRTVYGASDWRARVESLKMQGVLVEMIPLAKFGKGCFLECR